jgi:hypothetical protein
MVREQAFITEARGWAKQLLAAYNGLKALQTESNALDYANTLDDGVGENDGYTKDEVIAVVHTTTNDMTTWLASGHSTNLAKLL